jgi:ParB family transcriptional regulator, chromosome partitioning protein
MQENNEIKYIDLVDIIPNRLQPRTEFDEDKLNELATSIKQYGIINPLLVRKVGNKYEIIAGERRFKAAKIVGLERVPVIISNMDERTSAEVAVIENIQRQDLSALEEARSYRKLLDQASITQEQLAAKMGKSQSTIANKMRLLNLCDEVQEALDNNQISERHARSLLQLKNIDDQRNALEKIIKERLTVKATENLIKEILQSKTLNSEEETISTSLPPTPDNFVNNIYGNDIVSIADLNKKELEKENDNMNNEQNTQMNNNMPNIGVTNQQPNDQVQQPAFGGRFFPSLEDSEVNVNLANPFAQQQPAQAQPMMANLVDTPTPQQPPVAPTIPSFVTDSTTVPSSNTVSLDSLNKEPVMPTINPLQQNFESPISEPVNNIVAEPIINPIASSAQTSGPISESQPNPLFGNNIPEPQPQPEPIAPTIPNLPNMESNFFGAMTPNMETTVQPTMPTTEPTAPVVPEPIIPEPAVAPQPIVEPTSPVTPDPVMPDIQMPQNNFTVPSPEVPTPEPAPIVEKAPEVAPTIKTTDNIINAINAIKNLGLSIESIGYKTNISEEDTPTSYKITIELEK